MRYNQIVDGAGVPCMIQRFRYQYGRFMFEAELFTGATIEFEAEMLCQSLGLLQSAPTRMQYLEALNNATIFLEHNFKLLRGTGYVTLSRR